MFGSPGAFVVTDLLDADGNRPSVLLVVPFGGDPVVVERRNHLSDQIQGDPCAVPRTDERLVVGTRNASRRPDSVDASSTSPVRDDLLDRGVRFLFEYNAECREDVGVGSRGHEDVVGMDLLAVEFEPDRPACLTWPVTRVSEDVADRRGRAPVLQGCRSWGSR